MQDDQLLSDLAATGPHIEALLKTLTEHGITKYSQLFVLLRDSSATPELRITGCDVLYALYEHIDKRCAVPPLLVALRSSHEGLRSHAAETLGQLGGHRAVPVLCELAQDKNQPELVRLYSILALGSIGDNRAMPALRQIMHDQSDDPNLRDLAVERSADLNNADLLNDYLQLLSDPSPDIRFWAAFAIVRHLQTSDVVPMLESIDRAVAFDHAIPSRWGWHVDREMLPALEGIYYHLYQSANNEHTEANGHCGIELISPASEYRTFVDKYRRYSGQDHLYTTDPLPPITLKIDADWLAEKLQANWPDVILNQRQPRPQAYVLDWLIVIDGQHLWGALQRDQYAVVITTVIKAEAHAMDIFAAWYRGIIDAAQPLFLYEWAGPGKELRPGMTPDQVAKQRHKIYR